MYSFILDKNKLYITESNYNYSSGICINFEQVEKEEISSLIKLLQEIYDKAN